MFTCPLHNWASFESSCPECIKTITTTGNSDVHVMIPASSPSADPSILIEALEEIINPIKFMQERLKDGEKLDGYHAGELSRSAFYLKEIAQKALTQFKEGK